MKENDMKCHEMGEQDGEDCFKEASQSCSCHQKSVPRDQSELRQLKNRLSHMTVQLAGIGKMMEENRYCGDILTQVAAVESALQSFVYVILK